MLNCAPRLIDACFVEQIDDDPSLPYLLADEGRHLLISLKGRLTGLRSPRHSFEHEICYGDVDPKKTIPKSLPALLQEYYRLSIILNSHTKPFYCWHRRLYIMEEISNHLVESTAHAPLEMYAYENNPGIELDLTWQVLIEQELAFLKAIEQKKSFNLSFGQYCQMLMVHCYMRQDCIPIMALWEDFYLTLVYRCHPNKHYWTSLERVLRILHGTKAATILEGHRKRIQEMFEL